MASAIRAPARSERVFNFPAARSGAISSRCTSHHLQSTITDVTAYKLGRQCSWGRNKHAIKIIKHALEFRLTPWDVLAGLAGDGLQDLF